MLSELAHSLVSLRRNHPAWLLLASRNAPLTLSTLQILVDSHPDGVDYDDAVEQLSEVFTIYANDSEFETGGENHALAARKELRKWIKSGLIVEREGQIMATDALQRSLAFLNALEEKSMTSTASRLATVQREIENLEAKLSPDQERRSRLLQEKIAALEEEIEAVKRGDFEVLDGATAAEGIREVYQLAVSLRADFRRVEDSYREADRELRQRIIGEQHHRGEIVDELLAGHEALVGTPEGQVFEGFHRQLVQTADLEKMKSRLRSILDNDNADKALERKQRRDLRELVPSLVKESERVIQARARSERDVRSFLTSGLADEQLRVGALLQEIFRVALDVDWRSQKVRRAPGPLPPVAVSCPNIRVAERLLFKDAEADAAGDLDLSVAAGDPTQMDDEFWRAYRALDRAALFESTLRQLRERGEAMTLGDLASALPPTHDLETLSYWLAMARQAGIGIAAENEAEIENIDLFDEEETEWTRFRAPLLALTHEAVAALKPENME